MLYLSTKKVETGIGNLVSNMELFLVCNDFSKIDHMEKFFTNR